MKKTYLFKMAVLSITFASLLFIVGCSSSDNNSLANVVVQLTADGTTPYLVDQMTVSIKKSGGSVLTGVTTAQGIATIPVAESGDYDVIQVSGVDATNLAEGSAAGREFVKANPLINPYPTLTYTVSGVTVSVAAISGNNYNVNVTVPLINKVTVLKVASVTSDTNGVINVAGVTTAFAGRLMISNLVFNSTGGGPEAAIGIQSSDPNNNELVLYEGTDALTSGSFYGGPSFTGTSIGSISYLLAGPVYFEAPGTNGGDWALGYNLSLTSADLKTRQGLGGAGATLNFPSFYGGADNVIFRIRHISGGYAPYAYSCDYRIFQFDQY